MVSTASSQIISLAEEEERLEVALIQEEILRFLTDHVLEISRKNSINEPDLNSLITSLEKNLYSLSDLFNKVTQPLGLYEFSLIIIDAAQYSQHMPLVVALWTRLLQHEISEKSPNNAKVGITAKISALGKRFLPSETAFPLDYLIEWVCKACFNDHLASTPGSFLYCIFGDLPLEPQRIINAILDMILGGKSHQMPWKMPNGKLFLCSELVEFLSATSVKLASESIYLDLFQIAKDSEQLLDTSGGAVISTKIKELLNTPIH